VYSADEIIEMRKNGHRAMWITVAISSIPVVGVIFVLGNYIMSMLLFAAWTVPSLVKAYQKKPYAAATNGGVCTTGHGDFGGD